VWLHVAGLSLGSLSYMHRPSPIARQALAWHCIWICLFLVVSNNHTETNTNDSTASTFWAAAWITEKRLRENLGRIEGWITLSVMRVIGSPNSQTEIGILTCINKPTHGTRHLLEGHKLPDTFVAKASFTATHSKWWSVYVWSVYLYIHNPSSSYPISDHLLVSSPINSFSAQSNAGESRAIVLLCWRCCKFSGNFLVRFIKSFLEEMPHNIHGHYVGITLLPSTKLQNEYQDHHYWSLQSITLHNLTMTKHTASVSYLVS